MSEEKPSDVLYLALTCHDPTDGYMIQQVVAVCRTRRECELKLSQIYERESGKLWVGMAEIHIGKIKNVLRIAIESVTQAVLDSLSLEEGVIDG